MSSETKIMIPKSRFDEINEKYKLIKVKAEELETELTKLKSEIASEKILLQLKEIFVDGGFKKNEYEGIISRISCPTDEEKIELAKEIVKIKK